MFWFLHIYTIFKLKCHDGVCLQLDIFKLFKLHNSPNFKFRDMTFVKLNVNWTQLVSVKYSYQICTSLLPDRDMVLHIPFCSSEGYSINCIWWHFEVKEITFFQTKASSNILHFEVTGFSERIVVLLFTVVVYSSLPLRDNQKRTVPLLLAVSPQSTALSSSHRRHQSGIFPVLKLVASRRLISF